MGLGWELAQLAKSLTCKQDPCEVLRVGLKLAGQTAGLARSVFRERPCLIEVELWRETSGINFWPLHTCAQICTQACTYTCAHKTHSWACTEVTWRRSEALWLVQCWAPVNTHHKRWGRARRDQGQAGQEGAG